MFVEEVDSREAFKLRLDGMLEDVSEAQTLAELDVLESLGREYPEASHSLAQIAIEERRRRLLDFDPETKLRQLMEQLATLRSAQPVQAPPPPIVAKRPKSLRSYRLVKTNVDWTAKPQVHAVMEILKSIMKVGEVRSEDEIIEAMEMNVKVLGTTQPAVRIWNYYKGISADGLMMHGNIEKA